MKKIKIKMGLTSAVITAVVIACVILLNAMVALLGDKLPLKVDLTKDKVYEFADQTKELMKNLEEDVTAYALIPEGTQGEYIDYIKAYLDKYKTLSNKFKVEYIDPYDNPAFMNNYNDGENQASVGSVIIESGEKYKVVTFEQMYTQSQVTNAVQIDMEKKVTNAIMSVTGSLQTANIYFTQGHDEYTGQNLRSLLSDEGYKTDTVNIAVDGIPEDAGVIFSVVPMADYTAEERDALDAFMDKGGKLVIVAYPAMAPMERFDAYLEEWGLKLNYDFVVETDEKSALAAGTGVPIPVAKLQQHIITEKLLSSQSPLALPESMSISTLKSKNGAVATKLLTTSEKAYGKKNLGSATIEKEEGDTTGPLCMAAISEKMGDTSSAVMVIGSLSAVEAGQVISEQAFLNGDFILNSVNYLCGSKASSSIRAKQISAETMTMTESQVALAIIILQYILPAFILIIGLIVWLRRRYK